MVDIEILWGEKILGDLTHTKTIVLLICKTWRGVLEIKEYLLNYDLCLTEGMCLIWWILIK